MTQQPLIPVAKAIIYQADRLLLQLRDDKPDIVYPNCWGLFGGTIEPEETPEQAMKREIEEELCWTPAEFQFLFLWEEPETHSLTYLFAVPLNVTISQLVLTEGQAMRLFSLKELTDLSLVPKILRILPKVVESISVAELTSAWQALS